MLFYFTPGQLVARRVRTFSKMDPRSLGPFHVRKVSGAYRQRVTIEPIGDQPNKRTVIVHAGHLVPFHEPYVEPAAVDVEGDASSPREAIEASENEGVL